MIDIQIDGPPIAWKRPGHRSFKRQDKNEVIIYDRQKKEKEQKKADNAPKSLREMLMEIQ